MLAPARSSVLHRLRIPIAAAISMLLPGICAAQVVSFEGNGVARTGTYPVDTAIGDLDGDGHADFVVCDSPTAFTGVLKVFLVGPDGPDPFGFAVPLPHAPLGMVLADVDSDGDSDVVTLSSFGITVIRNTGTGTFVNPVTFPAGTTVRALDAGDIDGDGDVDIVVADYGVTAFSAQVLYNQGNGTYGAPVGKGTAGANGSQIVLSDVDGDSDLDLVLHEANFGAISVYRNLGSGSFSNPVYYSGSGIEALTLADIDGDNDPDMLFIDHFQLVIMRNVGGVFSILSTHGEPAFTMGITVADLDGDGDADLALAGYTGVRIRLNSGGGIFPTLSVAIAGQVLFAIAAGDLDRDADLDLVVTSLGGGSVAWLWNRGDANFAGCTQITGSPLAFSVGLGDLNGNGIPDAVATNAFLTVFLDPSMNSAAAPTTYASYTAARDARIADMDGDGYPDVVVARENPNAVSVGWNQGNGVLAQSSTYPAGTSPTFVRTADFDGDGDLDVVVVSRPTNSVSILSNLGARQFSAPTSYVVGTDPRWLDVGDLDGDLDLDLAVMNVGSGTVSILSNAGNGSFTTGASLAMPGFSVVAADLDEDGDLDLASSYTSVNFSRNTGAGNFAAAVPIPLVQAVSQIFAADLDHDGDQDLIGTSNGQQSVLWMQNLGGANFIQMPSTSAPVSNLALGDADVDGDIDVVTSSDLMGGIAIVRNTRASGSVICAGDGSAANCPCGNTSAPGARSGCLNSTGAGATIRADGPASVAHDRLVLHIDGMPNDTLAMILQGSSAESAGAGVVFGDGLRCVGGTLVRVRIEFAPLGGANYPGADDARLSTVGPIASGSDRVYQAWYRNGTSFCTSSTFNLTNGIVVRWGP